MVIVQFLWAHSDLVMLSLIALFVYIRRGKTITVSELIRTNFDKLILLTLVLFFVSVTIHSKEAAPDIATAMLDNVKTVVGALLILINAKRDPQSPAPVSPNPPAQGGA
jgi:hypothetical protein